MDNPRVLSLNTALAAKMFTYISEAGKFALSYYDETMSIAQQMEYKVEIDVIDIVEPVYAREVSEAIYGDSGLSSRKLFIGPNILPVARYSLIVANLCFNAFEETPFWTCLMTMVSSILERGGVAAALLPFELDIETRIPSYLRRQSLMDGIADQSFLVEIHGWAGSEDYGYTLPDGTHPGMKMVVITKVDG